MKTMEHIMEQVMTCANNKDLTDQAFADEVFLLYTDDYRKRYNAEHNMIRKSRSNFKQGDHFAYCVLETVFPKEEQESLVFYRQRIEMERMEKRMKEMERKMKEMEKCQTKSQEKSQERSQERSQEEFYDCQAELIQQKEYVKIFQTEEVHRKRRMLQYEEILKKKIQKIENESKGIDCTLHSLSQSPYWMFESVNRLKDKKESLLKEKEGYVELLEFVE